MELTVLLSREFYNITSDYWQRHNQVEKLAVKPIDLNCR